MAVAAVTARPAPQTDCIVGRSKLSGGTVSVALKRITDNSILIVSANGANVTGFLTTTITGGTGFSVTSSVGGDVGYVGWVVYIIQQAGT